MRYCSRLVQAFHGTRVIPTSANENAVVSAVVSPDYMLSKLKERVRDDMYQNTVTSESNSTRATLTVAVSTKGVPLHTPITLDPNTNPHSTTSCMTVARRAMRRHNLRQRKKRRLCQSSDRERPSPPSLAKPQITSRGVDTKPSTVSCGTIVKPSVVSCGVNTKPLVSSCVAFAEPSTVSCGIIVKPLVVSCVALPSCTEHRTQVEVTQTAATVVDRQVGHDSTDANRRRKMRQKCIKCGCRHTPFCQ